MPASRPAGTPRIATDIEGNLGVITLRRPEAINALDLTMIETIVATLGAWRDEAAVRAILFEGEGPRGFCAGGDVRAVRALMLEGKPEQAGAYFAAEYAMNALIARYAKPIAVLAHGAVMGGGIGIAGHARFRFCVGEAKFAMPEAAIGFVSDIGVNAILARAPAPRALAFLMAGTAVGPGDALALGLTDAAIAPERAGAVRASIVAAAGADSVETALAQAMSAESIVPDESLLSQLATRLAFAFEYETAGEIVAALAAAGETDPGARQLAETLALRSPTSLEAILQSHRAARSTPDIGVVLSIDLALARLMAGRADFVEGVRAVLVDKDHRPAWSPDRAEGVDRDAILRAITQPDAAGAGA